MKWQTLIFNQMSNYQLWQIYHARDQVFVTEEKIAYPDADSIDLRAHHLLGINNLGQLIAYARFFTNQNCVSFGRVLTVKSVRGQGYGKFLMKHLLAAINQTYPKRKIVINAQADKTGFYQKFGFKVVGKPFQIAGLKHVRMTK